MMQNSTLQIKSLTDDSLSGLVITIAIVGFWLTSLVFLLPASLAHVSWVWIGLAILGRTFLQTGLFVLAHDAMHMNLIPGSKLLNAWIGVLALGLYACLPYKQCCRNHWKHHRYPAQVGDPDFHDGIHHHPVRWYLKFMRSYLSIRLLATWIISWGLIFLGLNQVGQISLVNFLLFWLVPLALSSMQLFFFGTYLPHREQCQELNLSDRGQPYCLLLWSFLTCYHFGHYHWAHHQYPQTPWYKLPIAHRFGAALSDAGR